MCGIAGGIFQHDTDAVTVCLKKMVNSLAHRGPDSHGTNFFKVGNRKIGLGHTRLSILDLSEAGHQPMLSADAKICISYNGEIYNFKDLRQMLSSEPIQWKSQTDTEVLLQGYQKWGVEFLYRLRGMFAFALWDTEKQELLLARDPLGIKPLYYYQNNQTFLFSSELKSLLVTDLIPRRLSQTGLASYLQYGSVQSPLTMIEDVFSLLPGHCLKVQLKENKIETKQISFTKDIFQNLTSTITDYNKTKTELYEILKESIQRHLISDVPLGVFLSGGIDSSALVALMTEVTEKRSKTFSVVFDEKEFSEHSYAQVIAQKYKTDHHEIHLSENHLLKVLPEALSAMDQPTMDGINTFVISKAVKDSGITVALSGLGSDEIFAGYPSFKRVRCMKYVKHIPKILRKSISAIGSRVLGDSISKKKLWRLFSSDGNPHDIYQTSRELFSEKEIESLLGNSPMIMDPCMRDSLGDPINSLSEHEIKGYMMNTLLRDADCMSMAHALEVRVPFVDVEVIRFVLNLPGSLKISKDRPKPLLLDALGPRIPKVVWKRPKKGFTLPFERWMQTALKNEIEKAFKEIEQNSSFPLSKKMMNKVWQKFKEHPHRERWSRPWALYVLVKWCELNGVQ